MYICGNEKAGWVNLNTMEQMIIDIDKLSEIQNISEMAEDSTK